MIDAVIYYSDNGECAAIARYLSDRSGFDLLDATTLCVFDFERVILVFPVYCQSFPPTVKQILGKLRVERLSVVAAYGKMCCGNVIYEIKHKYGFKVTAAAYVPTKHAYLSEDRFSDFDKLLPIVEKQASDVEPNIPRLKKNVFAGFFPAMRSRMGVKTIKDRSLCDGCGQCERACVMGAVKRGVPNGKCIRCLKCVAVCPNKALSFRCSAVMRTYLGKRKRDELIIYV